MSILCFIEYRPMNGLSPPRQKPFFAAWGFFPSPLKPFELPVYVEPLARALAEQSLDDMEITGRAVDTKISWFNTCFVKSAHSHVHYFLVVCALHFFLLKKGRGWEHAHPPLKFSLHFF